MSEPIARQRQVRCLHVRRIGVVLQRGNMFDYLSLSVRMGIVVEGGIHCCNEMLTVSRVPQCVGT